MPIEPDDLVQDTIIRAITKAHLWQAGTDLRAWLFTIMHNLHVNDVRSTAREDAMIDIEEMSSSLDATSDLREADPAIWSRSSPTALKVRFLLPDHQMAVAKVDAESSTPRFDRGPAKVWNRRSAAGDDDRRMGEDAPVQTLPGGGSSGVSEGWRTAVPDRCGCRGLCADSRRRT